MPRPIFDQIITANALLEGDVVYFTAADTWTCDIQQAEVFSDEAIAQVQQKSADATSATSWCTARLGGTCFRRTLPGKLYCIRHQCPHPSCEQVKRPGDNACEKHATRGGRKTATVEEAPSETPV